MLTPREMDSVLAEFRVVAISAAVVDEASALVAMESWDARQFLLADQRSRSPYCWAPDSRETRVMEAMDVSGARLATWLTSMAREGFARERAVERLAVQRGHNPDRLLSLRIDDPLEVVRAKAWRALERRCSPGQAEAVAPILVRLSERWRAAGAINRYARVFKQHQGVPLWTVLLGHSDREARRWGFTAALEGGGISSERAIERLASESDQWVAVCLVNSVAASGDTNTLQALLVSRHATARAAALTSLPDVTLTDEVIKSALFDRAAKVRRQHATALPCGELQPESCTGSPGTSGVTLELSPEPPRAENVSNWPNCERWPATPTLGSDPRPSS